MTGLQICLRRDRIALEDSGLAASRNTPQIGVWVGSGIGSLETMKPA